MRIRRLVALLVVIGAAIWYRSLPPAPAVLTLANSDRPVRGAIHVHTKRSDGTGTLDSVAEAAAQAGLQFVIVTDHGDGTRPPEPPSYRSGVLILDALEVTTENGHVVALGLPTAPYPLGGEARDVIEDVHRLGGLAIAAHPGSARASLRWTAWETPVDGLEWLNADSEWRDETRLELIRALLAYPFGGPAALATLLDRPAAVMDHWDALAAHRRTVAVAASDAHARIGGTADRRTVGGRLAVPVPSYAQMFRVLSISLTGVRLTGTAVDDARAVLDAIREGHVYSTIDSLAGPGVLRFTAVSGTGQASGGDGLAIAGPVEIAATANVVSGGQIALLRNGQEVAVSDGQNLAFMGPPLPAVYRIEVRLSGAPGSPAIPWMVSNPIYVGQSAAAPDAVRDGVSTGAPSVYRDGPATAWRIEKSAQADGRLDVVPTVDGTQLMLRYGLGGTESEAGYVAAVVPLDAPGARAVTFLGRAARPSRVSVQLRTASGSRWRRSVYLDEAARPVRVRLDDMEPVAPAAGTIPPDEIRDLLFVIDTVNTALGTSGQIWLDEVSLER